MTQSHLSLRATTNLGSYYTPDFIVKKAYKMLEKAIGDKTNNHVLLDSSCGYGSFLKTHSFKYKIGADIDAQALQKAKENFKGDKTPPFFLHTNSLHQTSREKFNISQRDKLIVVGNPPYNDKTSIIKNTIKDSHFIGVDADLKARDLGISFLRSFDKIQADYVCVLHPLSYLIKRTNFQSLKNFTSNYRLLDSLIVSSLFFCPQSLGHFPIIIALYKRDERGMSFDFVCDFLFQTMEGKSFKINDFDFISKYIDKYPNKTRIAEAQKTAMFYTMRDINALRRSKTFIEKDCPNAVYVTQQKYSLYCYVNVFKNFIKHIPYYLGNCDVMIDYQTFKKVEGDFVEASESGKTTPSISTYFKTLLKEHYENP